MFEGRLGDIFQFNLASISKRQCPTGSDQVDMNLSRVTGYFIFLIMLAKSDVHSLMTLVEMGVFTAASITG